MAEELSEKDFDREFEAFIAGMKAAKHRPPVPPPPPPPFPPTGPDWYDGYDHRLPPPRPPFPPFPPVPPHPGPMPPGPGPKQPCPNCRPKSLDKYGFVPVVGGHYYTAGKSACCPVKVTITKITATTIYYKDKSGTPNEKPYHEFMTSSWKDRSL